MTWPVGTSLALRGEDKAVEARAARTKVTEECILENISDCCETWNGLQWRATGGAVGVDYIVYRPPAKVHHIYVDVSCQGLPYCVGQITLSLN